MTRDRQRRYKALCKRRLQGIMQADKKCRKLQMGEVPWSRTLQAAMDAIQLWKTVYSRKHRTRVSTRFISRLERRNSVKNSLKHTKLEIKTKLNKAFQQYYSLKKQAADLRETWLKDLAALRAKTHGGDQDTIFKSLLHREIQR